MQLNLAETICGFVEDALRPPFTIYADIIPDSEGDGACLRHDPAPAEKRRFLDGSRLLQWSLTLYTRCRRSDEARNWAKAITDALDGATITDPETETRIETAAATLPQFIGVDEKNLTTYCAGITAQYLEETEEQ